MAIYSDELGTSQSVTTTYSTANTYSPLTNGRLIGVRLYVAGDATTSLIEGVEVRLESVSFGGVPVTVMAVGAGIRTATTPPIPVGAVNCDLPVRTGVNITVQIKNVTNATPVTPQFMILGIFQA